MKKNKIIFLVGNDYVQNLKNIRIKNFLIIVANDKEFLTNNLKKKYKDHFKDRVSFIKYSQLKRILDRQNGQVIISLSWRRFISKQIYSKFKHAINIHPAILPKYKGVHPLPLIITNNEKVHGITAHLIEEKIDEGKIIMIKKFKINKFSTNESLQDLYNKHLPKFILTLLKRINDKKIRFTKPKKIKIKYFAKKRKPEDSLVDGNKSLFNSYDIIRAANQKKYPPYFIVHGQKVFISLSRRLPSSKKDNKYDI